MSEYVVEIGDPHGTDDGDVECVHEQRERVIRCRDCGRFRKVAGHHFCRRDGKAWPTSGYGFCAWAEPREEES